MSNPIGVDTARLRTPVRVASHAAVWAAVIVPTTVVLSKHWLAVGDDAAIAIRAFQTLSRQPPLVGMYSTAGAGSGHTLYDPGPLLFWLLALPVHIDPTRGLLWGAALLCGAVLSLTIEAILSTKQWLGAVAVPVAVLILLADWPTVFENLAWNAYFPLPFFIATIGVAWVVASGSFGWWPVLVFTGSVAAQCHLLFFPISTVLVIAAPLLAISLGSRPSRLRWLPIGSVVALACWLAPLTQTLGRSGNLSDLFTFRSGSDMGLTFGFKMLAASDSPSPIWLKRYPTGYFSTVALIGKSPSALGVAVFLLLLGAAYWNWRVRRRELCAMSLVGVLAAGSMVVTFAAYPTENGLNLDYLIPMLWIVGMLLWTIFACTVVTVFLDVRRRASSGHSQKHPSRAPRIAVAVGAMVCVGAVVVSALVGFREAASYEPNSSDSLGTAPLMASVARSARTIEARVPKGPVEVTVSSHGGGLFTALWMTEGIDWRLEADRWTPGATSIERAYTFLTPQEGAAPVTVDADGDTATSVTVAP